MTYLEEFVIRQVLQSKLTLTRVTWVSLTQHCVAIAWHHLARLECLPNEILQLLFGHIIPNLITELGDPQKHLQEK